MKNLFLNVRYAGRLLKKDLDFTFVALLALTLGIGANTAIFSVVYGALLAPLPYPNADQLVMVWSKINGRSNAVSAGDYLEWKRQNSVFQDMVAWSGNTFSLSVSDRPEPVQTRITSPGFFGMQGIPLSLGREFAATEGELGKNHVLIMTNRLWRERFGSDPGVIGRQVRLNGEAYTVIGVLAAGMPDRFESPLFVPLTFRPDQINHNFHWLTVMGRLKPGITLQQANADMDGVTKRIAGDYPLSNKGWGASVEPLKNDFTSSQTIKNLWLLLGAVGFVLLIACVNVANLQLARATTRQKEAALRASLGATRWQLFSQFLTESVVLALLGGALGVGLASIVLKVIVALLPQFSIPTEADVRLNLPVLFFSLGLTVMAGIVSGCAPAWQISGRDLNDALKEGGRSASGTGRSGLRRFLVVIEFALALTLLTGAGLVIHSFWKLTRVNLGFRADHILTFVLPIPVERFTESDRITAFYREILEKIEAVPGVSSAAASTGAPVIGTSWGMAFSIAGGPAEDPASRPNAGFTMVSPGYFRTFGIPIVKGRDFNDQDVAGGMPVAIVNETFAKKYLPNVDPLTQRVVVQQLGPRLGPLGPPIGWHIVGFYHDVHNGGVRREGFPEINVPLWQSPVPLVRMEVRTSSDPASMANSIAAAVRSVDSDLALDQVRTMEQLVDESLAGDRFVTTLFGAFSVVALTLAAIGIYGVMSFAVAQRTQEIGVRMALGATPGQVLTMMLLEGMALAVAGLILGLGGTYFVGRGLKSFLYQVTTIDPIAVISVATVLMLFAIFACYLPARRATHIDPMAALRQE
jgi:putative ABC transport system permease protein